MGNRARRTCALALLGAGLAAGSPAFAAPPQPERLDHEHIGRQLKVEAAIGARRTRSAQPHPRLQTRSPDGAPLPSMRHPTVHAQSSAHGRGAVGWSADLTQPRHEDRRRRGDPSPPPRAFGHKLEAGTRFVFDVYIAGNPAGTAEAFVAETKPDPRGAPPHGRPLTKLVGRATTGGVMSMLATVTDEMTSWVDAETGAPVLNHNVVKRSGLMAPYARRETHSVYEGRGSVRIVDRRDERVRKLSKHLPEDTLDAMGAMAWVRSLRLEPGERASAHALDGTLLMRIDVINRGRKPLRPMPSLGTALGLGDHNLELLEGTVTRVGRHKTPKPDARVASFRTWVSTDDRRIILALESDMWLGVIRIVLSRYDGPQASSRRAHAAPAVRISGSTGPSAAAIESAASGPDAAPHSAGPR
ncbi:MAG: DUF3108 domain-containing protein [Myxococcales bacterium FL481]|nr:MAG: DUF3108 domain-containing protein [Myxococcales bacterium FL481]